MTPGRYVGAEEAEADEDAPFEERFLTLTERINQQFAMSRDLEVAIRTALRSISQANR